MHRALEILEIAEMVCCHLRPQGHCAGQTLAALAASCRIWQDPALDALWATQDSLIPILSCMPQGLFNVEPSLPYFDSFRRMVRSLTLADWKRLSLYSHRVKDLSTSFESKMAEIYLILNLCLSPTALFPNLQTLSWDLNSEEEFPYIGRLITYIRIFLTSTLSGIAFGYTPSITNCSLLSTLGRTCPHLTAVKITLTDDEDESDDSTEATSLFLCSLPHIESITVPRLEWTALKHIAQSHRLTSLSMDLLPDLSSLVSPPSPYTFAGLQHLQLEAAQVGETLRLLQTGNYGYSVVEGMKLYTTLAVVCSPSSLIQLHIHLDGYYDTHDSAESAINDSMIRSLFPFRKLVCLTLTSTALFVIHDNTMMDAARAWPCLEELTLDFVSLPLVPPPSHLTLQSLCSLAQHCSRLRSLHITIDATVLPPPPAIAITPQRELTSMCIAHSAISQPRAVARLLSDIFPNFRHISASRRSSAMSVDMKATYARWEEVVSLVPEFVAVREEERARVQEGR
ncbi:hypothetical protein C8F04DRAFT_1095209 [Mycena alexandri]|uniref:F-box domain-containing protein n=1 Tax=Mycena alexandri TaxID=1745969 RepID=A0AAD6T188_9AGAR|nr:hypothetical protein C8F04DRAFT_1095209 [Mycena alexandri]